jgi:hypothetical protein
MKIKGRRIYLQYIDKEEGLVSLTFRTKASLLEHFEIKKDTIEEITYMSKKTPTYILDRLSEATVTSIVNLLDYYDQVAEGWETRAWINCKRNTIS